MSVDVSLPESTDEELQHWTENPPDGSILQELLSSVGSVESLVDLASNDVDMELDDGFSTIYHMMSYQQYSQGEMNPLVESMRR